jgi:hypothetical protein
VLTAGLLSGGAAGLLILAPQLAGAAEPLAGSLTQAPPTTEPTEPTEPATDAAPGRREERLTEILQPLVDDGTLTQEQADAVIAAIGDARPIIAHGGPMHGGFPGGGGFPGDLGMPGMPGFPGDMDLPGQFQIFAEGPGISINVGLPVGPETADLVANTIGITLDDLLTQLTDGQTVAEIAGANGVDPQAVIDAVVQHVNDRLLAAVDSGRLTQEEADERLANATERITNWVNGTGGEESGSAESGAAPDTSAADTTETTASA